MKQDFIWVRFYNLTIISELQTNDNHRLFHCLCDCWKTKNIFLNNMKRWLTKTCWCWMNRVFDLDWEKWEKVEWLNYFVSNKWRVKWEKWIIQPYKMNSWYSYYRLYNKDNKRYKQFLAHRLVMMTFIWKSKLDVNHKDWDKLNNNLDNLEYCTKSENMKHAYTYWLCKIKKWKEHYLYWKTWKDNKDSIKINQYSLDWEFIKTWDSISDIKRELWLSSWNICMVCKWKRNHSWWYKWSYAIRSKF